MSLCFHNTPLHSELLTTTDAYESKPSLPAHGLQSRSDVREDKTVAFAKYQVKVCRMLQAVVVTGRHIQQ